MRFKIKKLNIKDGYNAHKVAQGWDNENMWCGDKIESFELYSKFVTTFGVYLNNNLVGFGTIAYYPSFVNDENNNETRISYIVNSEYRRMGIANELLHYLIEFSSKKFNIQNVKVEILKSNIASISLIEKNCFNLVSFDDEAYVYEKKIVE